MTLFQGPDRLRSGKLWGKLVAAPCGLRLGSGLAVQGSGPFLHREQAPFVLRAWRAVLQAE